MNTVTSPDGTRIVFDRTGTGPAIILVDGAMCYRGAGPAGPLAAELARDFTVYTYDRRGRGDSDDTGTLAADPLSSDTPDADALSVAAPLSVEREAADLAALIECAGGTAYVFGHSSGAILALETSLRGAGIAKLALFEPPPVGDATAADLVKRLDELVRAGERGAAVEAFQTAIGIPAEMVAGMRTSPFRAALEAIAPTLVYDTTLTSSATLTRYAAVTVPTLVVDSLASSQPLRSSAADMARTVPGARHRSVPGRAHDADPQTLAPVLAEFFTEAG
ncbi:alpha/beta fold hydrolase [Nonomuraea zeae]|uniref:Alpha/beta hydrolase n=1 Tax=Nonomuraea zeae TaxID=1642303 RepID=A0A5S4G5W3_9ACTN|nr:alpha/beta hydrolase [Nonomuraea zeae]TMR21370.1 alpha/beta hydrolase [Nonomuraea zeae]